MMGLFLRGPRPEGRAGVGDFTRTPPLGYSHFVGLAVNCDTRSNANVYLPLAESAACSEYPKPLRPAFVSAGL